MITILTAPIRLIKDRYQTLPFKLTDGDGAAMDLTDFEFKCDLRYDADDVLPAVSLSSLTSPPTIVKDTMNGEATLIFDAASIASIVMPVDQDVDFPFAVLRGELVMIENSVEKPGFLFTAQVFNSVTRS